MRKELLKPKKLLVQGEQNKYDRILTTTVPGIAEAGTLFKLEGGFYLNEDETLLLRSNDVTGRYFKKIRTDGKEV